MVLSNLAQNVGVCRCYLVHIISCRFIVKSIPHLVAAAFVGRGVLLPLHTSWSRVLLQKLTSFHLFITVFTIAWHLPLPWASSIQPIPPTAHFLNIHLNIILPSMPGSLKRFLSLRFPHQNPVYTSLLPHMHYMPHLTNSSWFYHPNNIGWGVQIIKHLIMQFSSLPCYLIPLRPKYSPQCPIL